MIEYKSREVIKQLIYIIAISMAVIGVLFIPQIIFSRVKLSKTIEQNQGIEIAKTGLVSEKGLLSLKKVSSRNSSEITKVLSKDTEIDEEISENVKEEKSEVIFESKKETESKTEQEKSKVDSKTNKTTKSEAKNKEKKSTKKEAKSTETKNEAKSSKKSNTEKKDSKKETKKQDNKKSKKEEKKDNNNKVVEDGKKTAETKKEDKNSEENTSEKNDSSKKETTTKKENKKSTTKTVPISKVKISKSMNLTKRTGLSRKDFIKLMSGVRADTSGFFEKNAGKIYDLCQKYSINEIFFCGLISAESGWNIASNHRRTHNYISLMRNGKLISYGSVNEGLEVAAQKLHYNYLTPGGKFYHGKTLAGVKKCFCPSSSWVGLVYGRMRQIL